MPFALHVTDAQTGAPISGASIGEVSGGVTSPVPGSGATDAGGNVAIVLGHTGAVTLKATRADSVRSNGVTVCVHNGNDGTCGTTVPTPEKPAGKGPPPVIAPDVAKVLGITSGHVYRRRSAPRLLSGLVVLGQGGTLRQVRIALQRRSGRRCFQFSGSRERFVRVRHCGAPRYFSVGSAASFSYLLPRRLGVGRYIFAVQGVEVGGRTTRLVDGVSRVSFRVR